MSLRVAVGGAVLVALLVPAVGSGGGDVTVRTLRVGPGRATRTFELPERSGVILLSRLTVPSGVRAYVDATIPHVAGTRFSSGQADGPALSCRARGGRTACTQAQEWCPMPAATWRFRLLKLSGPGGTIRVDFVVGPPPAAGPRPSGAGPRG